ncbi:MAG: hypothetical protein HYV93_11270 [Candidatus Rokubacteria bacterium]|nr:hypothetical protein [Candidatus Rokubacteria bacterium]
MSRGAGPSWATYRVVGATRAGLADAKEGVGKQPERYKLVEPGTIFYNPMRILLGSIAFLDEGGVPGITSPDYVVFKTHPGLLHPRWFYYWLRSDAGASFIKTLARGAVRERMLFRRLAAAEIDVPPYEVQCEFARCIPAVERARAAAEAQLHAAKALPVGFLHAVFGGDDAKNWLRVRLSRLSSDPDAFSDGPFGSNLKTEHYASAGARVVRLQNIGRGAFLDADKAFIALEHFAGLRRYGVRPGDVVVAALGDGARPAGRACVIPDGLGPALVKADCFRLRFPADSVLAPYLAAYLNSPVALSRVADTMRGATRPRMTLTMLRTVEVPLAPVPQQREILRKLDEQMAAVERARAGAEAQLQAAKALPAALLRRAFGGAF